MVQKNATTSIKLSGFTRVCGALVLLAVFASATLWNGCTDACLDSAACNNASGTAEEDNDNESAESSE